jgi:hypothetical protein
MLVTTATIYNDGQYDVTVRDIDGGLVTIKPGERARVTMRDAVEGGMRDGSDGQHDTRTSVARAQRVNKYAVHDQ